MFQHKSEVKRNSKLGEVVSNIHKDSGSQIPESMVDNLEIMKQGVRQHLNTLILNNIVVPKIIWHIDIQVGGIYIKYSEQLASLLQNICSINTQNVSLNDERLIVKILKIINNSITQQGFQSLEYTAQDLAEIKRIFNQIQIIEEPSKYLIKIIQQIRLIRFEAQYHKKTYQIVKMQEPEIPAPQIEQIIPIPPANNKQTTEQINDNILKILLMKLNEFNIIIPNLLGNLQFTTEGRRYDFYYHKELLVIRSTNEVMLEILQNPKMRTFLQEQQLTQFPRQQILQQLMADIPESKSLTLLNVQEKTIELMVDKCDQNLEGFLSVFVDERFRALLQQVHSLCGTKIKLIMDGKVKEVEHVHEGNVLKIGCMLMRMQQILQSFQPNSSQLTRIKQNQYNLEGTGEKRCLYGEIYSTTNPVYKKFITKLVVKQQAFPYFLKTIHVRKFVVQISYRKSLIQELLTFPKFLYFLKKEFQLEFDEYETINQKIRRVQEIGRPEYEDEDGRLTWPKLIYRQLNLIYEQREQLTEELIEAVGSRKYQQLLKDLNNIQELIPDRRAIKDIIFDINDYILTLS